MAVSVPFGPVSCRWSLQVPSCLLQRWICADSFVTLPSFHFLLPAPRPTSSSRKRELRGCHLLVGTPFFGLYIEDFVWYECVSKKDVCKYLSACSRLAWRRTGLNRNGGPCYADKWGIFLALFVATWRKKLCSLYAYAARLLEGLHLSCHPNEKETNTQAKTSELKNLCYHQQIEFILKKTKAYQQP